MIIFNIICHRVKLENVKMVIEVDTNVILIT